MDGNRRFAKKLMMKPWKGHEWGKKKVEHVLKWCSQLGVKEVTFYALSIQNLDRPKKEFDYLMNLFTEAFVSLKNRINELQEKGIRITAIGRLHLLPKKLQQATSEIMERTKNNKKMLVNFAIAYGGREEVIDAVHKIGKAITKGKLDVQRLNEEVFAKYLYTKDEPDLIIRTGGEQRTSNFLPWQSIYSEWFFLDKYWPELEEKDLIAVVHEYNQRERRFGR